MRQARRQPQGACPIVIKMTEKYFKILIFLVFFNFFTGPIPNLFAREFRQVIPLLPPGSKPNLSYAPSGQIIKPVEPKVIDAAVKTICDSYNTPAFAEKLSANFYDAAKLNDSITENVSRDAKLRVVALRNSHILSQTIEGNQLVSHVSVTVQSQLEFNNASGFQQRDGTNELILKITQKVSP